jgi:hypothetical protein
VSDIVFNRDELYIMETQTHTLTFSIENIGKTPIHDLAIRGSQVLSAEGPNGVKKSKRLYEQPHTTEWAVTCSAKNGVFYVPKGNSVT